MKFSTNKCSRCHISTTKTGSKFLVACKYREKINVKHSNSEVKTLLFWPLKLSQTVHIQWITCDSCSDIWHCSWKFQISRLFNPWRCWIWHFCGLLGDTYVGKCEKPVTGILPLEYVIPWPQVSPVKVFKTHRSSQPLSLNILQ